MKYLVLAILWITWCTVHSGMITLAVTNYLKEEWGERFRFYRMIFNLIAGATVVPIVLYEFFIAGPAYFDWTGTLWIVRIVLVIAAVLLFLSGGRQYDMLEFLGIRQIEEKVSHQTISETGGLSTHGVLGMVRHPWYLGGIILLWSRELNGASLTTNLILSAYLVIGAFLEEKKLLVEFGDTYRDYQKKVSMFLPVKWVLSKFKRKAV